MESYASTEPRIGIVKTAMGARAQFAVFTYAEMWQTPRYEIRLSLIHILLLLRLLAEKDMYGYEMIDTLRKKSCNVFELKAGTL